MTVEEIRAEVALFEGKTLGFALIWSSFEYDEDLPSLVLAKLAKTSFVAGCFTRGGIRRKEYLSPA